MSTRPSSIVVNFECTNTVAQTLDFYPYGATRISSATGGSEKHQFVGQYADISNLSYLNARYYDSTRGQFLSQDPVFWSLAADLLNDPQQLNSYSYARNNPVNLADPTGLLTVVIPGTNYDKNDWSSSGAASAFISSVGKTFNETAEVLHWSGRDNSRARQEAANSLQSLVQSHPFADGEKLYIVGHSHGGNIGILFSQMTDRKIDNLVTLGTPVRSDYKPNYDMIGTHYNAYSKSDLVQVLGGGQASAAKFVGRTAFGASGGLVGSYFGYGEFGPAGRTYKDASNLDVTDKSASWVGAHHVLWANPYAWSQISGTITE